MTGVTTQLRFSPELNRHFTHLHFELCYYAAMAPEWRSTAMQTCIAEFSELCGRMEDLLVLDHAIDSQLVRKCGIPNIDRALAALGDRHLDHGTRHCLIHPFACALVRARDVLLKSARQTVANNSDEAMPDFPWLDSYPAGFDSPSANILPHSLTSFNSAKAAPKEPLSKAS